MITAKMVQDLRERTGVGMMDCKRALMECGGDLEAAADLLRTSGQAKADKKSGRVTAEGLIAIAVNPNQEEATMLEANCETDFVARDTNFVAFANTAAKVALEHGLTDVAALPEQSFDGTNTVEATRTTLVAKLGENMNIRRLAHVTVPSGAHLGAYIHQGRIGVLVVLQGGTAALAKDMAMQIAANNPAVISGDDVEPEVLAREKAIFVAQAQESGKPADVIEKMIQGRLRKFCDEVSLVGQPYLKNPDQTVSQVLKQANATVLSFVRFAVGEGIEKQVTNFAEEVMQQVQGSAR
jgi:elongation factor Ts